MYRIGGLPATLVASIDRGTCGTLCTAFGTELAGINRSTGACPAWRRIGIGLFRAAFRTEFAGGCRTAGACPCVCVSLHGCALLCAKLEQLSGVHTAALLGHVHAQEAGKRPALIFRRILHGLRLRAYQMRRRHVGVAEDSVPL